MFIDRDRYPDPPRSLGAKWIPEAHFVAMLRSYGAPGFWTASRLLTSRSLRSEINRTASLRFQAEFANQILRNDRWKMIRQLQTSSLH